MTFTFNSIELELPEGAQVQVSADGKKLKIAIPETTAVEKIRVIETPGPERIVERIRVVEVEGPCNKQHYPHPVYPYIRWTGGNSLTTGTVSENVWNGGTSTITTATL